MTLLAILASCQASSTAIVYEFFPHFDSVPSEAEIEEFRKAKHEKKFLRIINDSILQKVIRYGDFYPSSSYKYIRLGDTLVVTASIPPPGEIVAMNNREHYLYSRDSLVNLRTGERFYTEKFIDKENKKYMKTPEMKRKRKQGKKILKQYKKILRINNDSIRKIKEKELEQSLKELE
jgi:hypothetical protein